MATGTIVLPVQSAKISGAFISNPARINGGGNAWSLLFSASQTESGLWQFRMPENFASGLIAKLQSSMASAVAGNIVYEIDIMAITPGDAQDVDVASFDTVNNSGAIAVPGTAGYLFEKSMALSNVDNVAAGDLVYCRLKRKHDDSNDTASGDSELRALSLEYTTT